FPSNIQCQGSTVPACSPFADVVLPPRIFSLVSQSALDPSLFAVSESSRDVSPQARWTLPLLPASCRYRPCTKKRRQPRPSHARAYNRSTPRRLHSLRLSCSEMTLLHRPLLRP